ncbi:MULTISPECIES: type I restriction-modification system subunit M [Neisseria]|uniref:site-specific DNA-methyltransferase (adenine-specific) n=2 Tax=Neisseria TaxID=482 RepID=A0ABD7EVK3_NEIPE|nr:MULTISPECIES: type I restriction-modification system subunit M [Neisseria]QXW89807.1 type I restriction-modification system subunit M [Neisseria perflava]QXW94918.1 type I restriction-modification system subunit M [Neisseria sicca ATCC 29256]
MNKQQLAAKIWQSANKMRSKIEANEYKDYILGFIFYKFLSDKLEKFALEQGLEKSNFADELTEANGELVNHIKRNLGYFISYEHLFSTWLAQGSDFNIANVRTAMSAFSRNIAENYISVFDGIFKTLESGLSKLGDTAASQTNAVKDLFVLIADIPMDGKQGYDVLGFIYEYLISMFAANAGKKAGEFYTPHEVSLLMSEIIADHLKDREEISIYDPTSGSGSLLINIGHSVAKHLKSADSIKYYAQELKENTYNLTRMNLVMRGILPSNIFTRNADTLEDDWPLEGDPLYLDAVVSNPPYSQPWNPKDKEGDIRYKRFGVAPQAKADFAFLLHDLFHLKPEGIMTIVLPHGVLFRGGEEEKIRKNLIEYNHIDAIIGLPANIFFGTGIPTIIIVLRQERERNDVLMIDASKHFIKVGKNNHLQASDIKRIVDCVTHRRELPKFSRIVPKAEIVANGYNLNIPRYVDSAEPTEQWDIFATIHGGIPKAELAQFADYWAAFDGLQTALFTDNGTPYVQPKTNNLKAAMQSHASVLNYQAQFAENFADFTTSLETLLIEPMETLNISQTQQQLAELIREKVQAMPLLDFYTAYQKLDDLWRADVAGIAADLEMIQTEGKQAIKQVDPFMVLKKDSKTKKEAEVQDGWVGHILPFELVQAVKLPQELANLKAKETRLAEIAAEMQSILENLSEEEKACPAVNEEGDGFINAEIPKALQQELEADGIVIAKKADLTKAIDKHIFAEESLGAKLQTAYKLLAEEKTLKAELKTLSAELHSKTKAAIEALDDAEALDLLRQKWFVPLNEAMCRLPENMLAQFSQRLTALCDKYADTYQHISERKQESAAELAQMMDELTGSEFDLQGIAAWQAILKG